MLEQIKKDACWLFEEERSDKDSVKYAMTMYLLSIGVFTLIFGVAGLVTVVVVEWLRAKKKTADTPANGQTQNTHSLNK